MPAETNEVEYRTVQIGAPLLVKGIMNRLSVGITRDDLVAALPAAAGGLGFPLTADSAVPF